MGIFSETFESMDDLLQHQLKDLYDAEHRIHGDLESGSDAVQSSELKTALTTFRTGCERRISRLEEMFAKTGNSPERETCEGTKGLLEEVADAVGAKGNLEVRDAAIIGGYQRVAHYAIAGYGTARNVARRAGQEYVAELCQQSLDEAYEFDRKLTDIAVQHVNPVAAS